MQIEQKARTLFPTNRIMPLLTIINDSLKNSVNSVNDFTKIRRLETDLSGQCSKNSINVMTGLTLMIAMPFNLMI